MKVKIFAIGGFCLTIFIALYLFTAFTTESKDTYSPKKEEAPLLNPLKGYAPEAQYTDYKRPHSLVYANLSWKELEPKEGFYDFETIEKKYNYKYWKDKGVKFVIRIILDYPKPEEEMDIPDWLYKKIKGDGTHYSIPYGKGFSPDYANETLIAYHEKLIKAIGEKYNDDPEIAFVELGSIGHWGEWHTYDEGPNKIPFPSKTTCEIYVSHYLKYLGNKKFLTRRPFTFSKDNNFGLFNDVIGLKRDTKEFISWINNGYFNPLTNSNEPPMKDFWKTAPSGGEIASGDSGLRRYFNDKNIDYTLNSIKETHVTFIGPNCPINKDNSLNENYDKVLKALGYNFTIEKSTYYKKLNPSKDLSLDLTINNTGIAPFYYNWPVQISLINSSNSIVESKIVDCDITKWLPGENNISISYKVDKELEKGDYTLAISVLDPISKKASLSFGNGDEILDKTYKIGSVVVS